MRFLNYIFPLLIALTITTPPCYCQDRLDTLSATEITKRELNICDTSCTSVEIFNAKQLILPGALMVTGIIGAIDHDNNLNKSVRNGDYEAGKNKAKGKGWLIGEHPALNFKMRIECPNVEIWDMEQNMPFMKLAPT